MANKPATRADLKALAAGSAYKSTEPNRKQRRSILHSSDRSHNNRKVTSARKTQYTQVESLQPIPGKYAPANRLGVKAPLFERIKTGVIKSIRFLPRWKWGGNNA